MANMTLRLDDAEEQELQEIAQWLNENTKSKALIRIIKTHRAQHARLNEYIERTRKAEYELNQIKTLLKERELLETMLKKLLG